MATSAGQVVVQWDGGDANMLISVTGDTFQKTLNREPSEPIDKCLARLRASVAKKPKRKKKAAGKDKDAGPDPPEDALPVTLYKSTACDESVPATTPNHSAWTLASVLLVGDVLLPVIVNPPMVRAMHLHAKPMVGCPLLPVPELAYADEERCAWSWERVEADAGNAAAPLATTRAYTPTDVDVGKQLRVTCTPAACSDGQAGQVRKGESFVMDSEPIRDYPAEATGSFAAAEAAVEAPAFRVLTYNLLADQYASQDYAQKVLFGHVAPHLLDVDYRKQVILRELQRSNADIMCLQEVDRKVFERYLQPQLAALGYSGVYTNKAGQVAEGSATFFRNTRFTLESRHDLDMRQLLTDVLPPHLSCFKPMLDASPHLRSALRQVTTIGQATVLRSAHGAQEPLLVANTHLFFHHVASHIRNMHAATIMLEAHRIMSDLRRNAQRPAVLFCGDFNSDLNDGTPGVVQLLQTGQLGAEYWDWAVGADFAFEDARDNEAREQQMAQADTATANAEAAPAPEANPSRLLSASNTKGVSITGVDVRLPFAFAPSHPLDKTSFTNHVPGYSGLLDYIWCEQGRLRVRKARPVPSVNEMGTFLPSARFPSDHLPVVADLELVSSAPFANADASGALASEVRPTSAGGLPGNVLPAESQNVADAIAVLRAGGIIAVPTDTLYGLAGLALSSSATSRIYDIKGRHTSVPLAICVSDVADVSSYGECSHLPKGLIESLLPGPVTVVLAKRNDAPVADNLNPGRPGIAIRVPDSGFVCELCGSLGGAITLTSANQSGRPSTLSVTEFRDLWGLIDRVFDGGPITGIRSGSTIVELMPESGYRILRDGSALEATTATLARFGLSAATYA